MIEQQRISTTATTNDDDGDSSDDEDVEEGKGRENINSDRHSRLIRHGAVDSERFADDGVEVRWRHKLVIDKRVSVVCSSRSEDLFAKLTLHALVQSELVEVSSKGVRVCVLACEDEGAMRELEAT